MNDEPGTEVDGIAVAAVGGTPPSGNGSNATVRTGTDDERVGW